MINTSRIFSNAVVSVAQTIISGVVLFVLYRYLIDHLGAAQLGLWSVILASTSVARLSDMGLTGSVVKFVARYRALEENNHAAEVVQTAALSIAGVMAILCLAIYPLLDKVLKLTIPAASMSQAIEILPWAIFSLWLGSVGGVFQSALDGCQRMDIRNIIMIFGNLIFLSAAYWLVPNFGLIGLAVGQSVQGLMLMLVSWLVLRNQLKTLPWLPFRFCKLKFKEMFGYAVNFQINSIAILLFDPAIKLLMSRYGGLSSTAYYEMANQLVVKLRALLISANQVLVPAVAELYVTAPEKVSSIYLKTYRLIFLATIPFYTIIFISLPLVSILWIGHLENKFLLFGTILISGWSINTLVGPAYFVNLGTGDLKWNSVGHVVMAILNVALGLLLGSLFGGMGVAIGAMLAMTVASIFIIYALHKQYKIPFYLLLPIEHKLLFYMSVFFVADFIWVNSINLFQQKVLLITITSIGLYLLALGVVVWFHPYKILVLAHISNRKKQ